MYKKINDLQGKGDNDSKEGIQPGTETTQNTASGKIVVFGKKIRRNYDG